MAIKEVKKEATGTQKKEGLFCIENPLMDVLVNVKDEDLKSLNLNKGIMHLIDEDQRKKLLDYIKSKDKTFICGGSGPNTTISVSALGVKSAFSGKVGHDEYGTRYEEQLKRRNVISRLKYGNGNTGSCIVLITPDTERTMNTYLGMCRSYAASDIDEDCMASAEYFYFTGYMWDTDSQKDAVMKAIALAEKHGTKLVFDVADPFCVSRNKDDFLSIIKNHAKIVFANKEESKILFDTDDPELAAKKLSALCDIGVVKIGKEGSLLAHGGKITKIPGRKVIAVDTTGAGDNFSAGFIFGMCRGFGPEKAALFASYLASEIVTQKGAQFSDEKVKEIKHNLDTGKWDFTKNK